MKKVFTIKNTSTIPTDEIKKFVSFCYKHLGLNSNEELTIHIVKNRGEEMKTLAYYDYINHVIKVLGDGRHILDVFRSLAHELVHFKQFQEGKLNDTAQLGQDNDGVDIENEANAVAGVIMRKYGRENANLY